MAENQLAKVVEHARRLVSTHKTAEQTDGALLRAFSTGNDQAAFAALVKRHGALVLAVCRRVLRQDQDAEDAFQATFLFLARRAASLHKQGSLAGWLHGVARRMATNARRANARRRRHERQAKSMEPANPAWEAAWREVQVLLDEEIQRLPEKYREPFILCCLENQGGAAVALRLGLKEGTVWSRLAEARKRLARRLAKRGVALSAALTAATLAPSQVVATVPASLASATVAASLSIATGKAFTTGIVSASVAALVEGMTRAMLMTKVKIGVALLVFVREG